MPQILITQDNSPTLINEVLGVTYHSVFGAKGESEYVFIQQSELENKLKTQEQVQIVEVGLGTGLNAWLSYQYAQKYPDTKVVYTAFEINPLSSEILEVFYTALQDTDFASVITNFPQNTTLNNFQTDFYLCSWLEADLNPNTADIIFYDAFAPKVCPELWTQEALTKAVSTLKTNGVLTTFSVTGQVKRFLQKMPVQILTPKGFAKKRQMLKVIKQGMPDC
ncbi:MAG: tRNA (5-methylaminomethyl-2-thiouridine)(34)-methyltransferase MnmD [Bacteroidia bacterium]|nr:tRNA (5-methylaminomethyl-2-thiouridine)(34)-methyltransferase MnmD [Bacteroidia bacterium]MDW8346828.1 tRNA (5-methylaminomethyl-2-thiouridine)(34)-methyltransferase MnmD [Bacteroidia bacterium]